MDTFGLIGLVVPELFVEIGDRFAGFFDETEFEMIVMLFAEIEAGRLGLATPAVAVSLKDIGCFGHSQLLRSLDLSAEWAKTLVI